jgi:hypothetical protein
VECGYDNNLRKEDEKPAEELSSNGRTFEKY